jgi:1,4-dihydroxy-2-naphthoate octaprenyltransferase
MNSFQQLLIKKIGQSFKPFFLLLILVFYLMGAGIHKYLGGIVDWGRFAIGLLCILLLHSSSLLLEVYFEDQDAETYHIVNPIKKDRKDNQISVNKMLFSAGLATFASGGILTYVMIIQKVLTPVSSMVLGIAFISSLLYAIPPFNLASRGFGEVVQSILISAIYPAFAFLIQSSELHRLIPMITFSFTPLLLATMISIGMPKYLQNILEHKKTILVVLKWKLGIEIHNIMIFLSYFILGLAALFGLSWSLIWPFLLPMPLSILSVIEVLRIRIGAKPRWSILLLGGYGSLGCTIYLLTFALWTG